MGKIMNKEELIKKWLDDELNEAELVQFRKLEEYDAYQKIARHAAFFKAPDYNSSEAYENLMDALSRKKAKRGLLVRLRPVLQMAAVLVLGFAIFKLFFDADITTYKSLAGQTFEIALPDASSVQLNAFSELSISEEDWVNHRLVKLHGEAYFKVQKGSQFDVETDVGTVRVVGTEFNVKSRNELFEITCYEGQVNVLYEGEIVTLPEGKSVLWLAGERRMSETTYVTPTWTGGISSFRSMPFKEVIEELQRQYGITIETDFETNDSFTGTFVNNNLKEALAAITIPYGLNYQMNNERVILTKLD